MLKCETLKSKENVYALKAIQMWKAIQMSKSKVKILKQTQCHALLKSHWNVKHFKCSSKYSKNFIN